MAKIILAIMFGLFATAFSQSSVNPADSVNSTEIDKQAVKIAGNVMDALGGSKNWDKTHYVCWNFFGRRFHIWDKWNGNLRLEEDSLIVLINLNSRNGRAWQNLKEIIDSNSLNRILEHAYAAWVNDGYWMFMPYKLRDPGVILQYKGEGVTIDGDSADILQLTFENVGLTPHNKYRVYVDKKSHLVIQWDYFKYAEDNKPTIQRPWNNWKRYGNIMLSDDRGKSKMSDVAVFEKLPENVFNDPAPVDIHQLMKK